MPMKVHLPEGCSPAQLQRAPQKAQLQHTEAQLQRAVAQQRPRGPGKAALRWPSSSEAAAQRAPSDPKVQGAGGAQSLAEEGGGGRDERRSAGRSNQQAAVTGECWGGRQRCWQRSRPGDWRQGIAAAAIGTKVRRVWEVRLPPVSVGQYSATAAVLPPPPSHRFGRAAWTPLLRTSKKVASRSSRPRSPPGRAGLCGSGASRSPPTRPLALPSTPCRCQPFNPAAG